MKKIFFALAVLTCAVSQLSCKKDKKEEEDITPMFQNKIWTGEMKYENTPVSEPFSLTFDGLGKLTMEERSGTSNGVYSTDKASNSITIQLVKGTFKAVISNKRFSTITYIGTYPWSIKSGELNEEIPVLTNTVYKGTQMVPPNTQQPWQLRFVSDTKFNLNEGVDNFPYTRSGVNIRLEFVNSGYYFVLQPHNKIKGIFWDFFSNPGVSIFRSYDLTKQ